ncbi:MAG: DUF433 domain-containing protein [Armatimonadetes bacterium]|nr:DUF433 domain-containing protein [Armatimonadota bacterium]
MLLKGEGIETHPEVSGGDACIAHTRIPVWSLVQYRRLGATDAELLQWYPDLTSGDLENAWAYYQTHQDEIERQIEENEAA